MTMELKLINDITEVDRLTAWIEQLSEACDLPVDKAFQLNLALEEAVVNVINYAYPEQHNMPITLEADVTSDAIDFRLIDQGIPFDPTTVDKPDTSLSVEERPIGGLGIMLVRQFMECLTYEYRDGSNILTMKFRIQH